MKYDDMIASGAWGGSNLEIRSRMAAYGVDGKRLGAIDWPTRAGVLTDLLLDKWSNEVLGVALILGRLRYENVQLISFDPAGHKLEKPDFDVVLPTGVRIGVEQADVEATADRKHEVETEILAGAITTLINTDASFAAAFGNHHVIVFPSNHVVGKFSFESKKDRIRVQAEIEQFIRSGAHAAGGSAESFSSSYPLLQSRGATWHCSKVPVPIFDIGRGSNNAGYPILADVIRVLDRHRSAAVNYRKLPLWLTLLVTNRWEFSRRTLNAVADANLSIEPFERCYLMDDTARVLELQMGAAPVFVP